MNHPKHSLAILFLATIWLDSSQVLAQRTKPEGEFRQIQLYERPSGTIQRVEQHLKHSSEIMRACAPLAERIRNSVVRISQDGSQVALATIVSPAGYALSKASEIDSKKSITCRLATGKSTDAKIIDTSDRWDLALLKLEGENWSPIVWSMRKPELGAFLIGADTGAMPYSVGSVSVLPRRLIRGFLGIEMESVESGGVRVTNVVENSAADKAGIKRGDIVMRIGEDQIKSIVDLSRAIGNRRPGEEVEIEIQREEDSKTVNAELTERQTVLPPNDSRFGLLGLALNKRRTGFPVVLQHDLFLRPQQCGGPLLDLDGNAVGLNIARNDRVANYAIPGYLIPSLLDVDEQGKVWFAKPMTELVADLDSVQTNINDTMTELQELMTKYQNIQEAIERAKKKANK